MNSKEVFVLIVQGIGAYFIYQAIFGAVNLLAVACGFELHLRNAPAADAFCYISYFLIGLMFVFWSARIANFVYGGVGKGDGALDRQASNDVPTFPSADLSPTD